MPKKEHVGYTRLSKKQLDNYVKGKSFTVKPSDHDDESNTVVKLHYKAKKNLISRKFCEIYSEYIW